MKLTETLDKKFTDLGLLIMRASFGLLLAFGHGWGKLSGFSTMAPHFPDPFGVGSTFSLALAIFAEFFCSIAVTLGILARLAVLPLIIMFLTAIFIIHANDPWEKKEFALLYLIPFVTILLIGPGKYSLDNLIFKWKKNE